MKKIVGLALLAVACGGETTAPVAPPPPPPPPNPVGTYNLTTINAVRLPVTVTLEGVTIVITSSVLNIRSGNTYSGNVTGHDPITGIGVTVGATGTWTQAGSTITMRGDSGGCTDLAIIEGRTLRIARDCAYGWEMVYQR
ncbi:hypothetical protein [Candidatus Palauibacter sp.]|uniref:hypothetical protein n=1 Tax=Candidatus Palauibacter sp. TaxID=3101350 RepID=UPI003B02CC7E